MNRSLSDCLAFSGAIFENHSIRRVYDENAEVWWFSVVDIVQVLTPQPDNQAARNYWKLLKTAYPRRACSTGDGSSE
jgi:prophage antirepressor-like protein